MDNAFLIQNELKSRANHETGFFSLNDHVLWNHLFLKACNVMVLLKWRQNWS